MDDPAEYRGLGAVGSDAASARIGESVGESGTCGGWGYISDAFENEAYNRLPPLLDLYAACDGWTRCEGSAAAECCGVDDVLVSILQPYVLSGHGKNRVKDLERVISQGAQFAYTLFSQPTFFRFGWSAKGKLDEVIVFPALVKVGDEKGQRLRREVVVCGSEAMRLRGRAG